MALATSYELGDRPSQRGARESLDNTIRRVSPESCPLYSTLSRGPRAQAMLSEWIVDDLSEVNFPGHVDGAPLAFQGSNGADDFVDKTTERVRFGARVQQFQRTFAVSPQAEAVNVAGPDNLYAMSKSRALIELKRDMESAIGSDQQARVGTNAVGDRFAGLGTWTNPNSNDPLTYGGAPVPPAPGDPRRAFRSVANARHTLTGADFVESDFRDMLQACFELHGNAPSYKLFAGPSVVNKVADMTRITSAGDGFGYQFTQDVGNGTLKLQVQEYISDWGRVFIVPSLFLGRTSGTAFNDQARNRAYLLPSDNGISLRFLEDVRTIDLEDIDGAGKRGLVRAMFTLTCATAGKPLGSIV